MSMTRFVGVCFLFLVWNFLSFIVVGTSSLLLSHCTSSLLFCFPNRKNIQAHQTVLFGVATSSRMKDASPTSNWRIVGSTNESSTFPFDQPGVYWLESQYKNSLELYDQLRNDEEDPHIQDALDCLDGAYRLYGPEHVIGSYNGGKDAVAILHLMRAAHAHYYFQKNIDQRHYLRPRVVYFDHPDEFPEVIQLLQDTVVKYDLDMMQFNTSFRDGLQVLVETSQQKQLAFVLGTRTSDPNANSQGQFSPSSPYMPPFMRVNPIIAWNYGHVWNFLRKYKLPYCILYDQGYTSLGTVQDTLRCPALLRQEGEQGSDYWPAFMLTDWEQERAGRITSTTRNDNTQRKNTPPSLLLCQYDTTTLKYQTDETTTATSSGTTLTSTLYSQSSSTVSMTEAGPNTTVIGLLIIGDEILKGLCSDTNIFSAAAALRSNGLLLSKVVVVSDEQEVIVNEIQRMEQEVDVIITSGGVGATHDDVTIHSVSVALSSPLVYHEELGEFIKKKMGSPLTSAQIKMATLPKISQLRYLSGPEEWPTLQCRNIYVLPGVPKYFKNKVDALASYLIRTVSLERSVTFKVVVSVDETRIVECLNEIVDKHPYVSIGSYPVLDQPDYKTLITLEGKEGPSLFPGETRVTLRRRSESLIRQQQQEQSINNNGKLTSNRGSSVPLTTTSFSNSIRNNSVASALSGIVFTKGEMDLHVKAALADLVDRLPDGSVLRVDNCDELK